MISRLPGGINAMIRESHSTLSLGQRQRLLLARSLYSARPILLLDEPTANLDEETAQLVIKAIKTHCEKTGKTLIVVTHSNKIASSFQREYRIVDGQLYPHEQIANISNIRGAACASLNETEVVIS